VCVREILKTTTGNKVHQEAQSKSHQKRNFFDGLLCSDLTQIFQKKINLFQTPKIAGLMRDQIDFKFTNDKWQ